MSTTRKKISSGVWALEQDMVRCFLITGSQRGILLDTGAEPCDLLGLVREVTDLPLLLLHTHGDVDHTANDHLFQDIYAHPKEFAVIRKFRPELTAKLHPITRDSSFDLGGRLLQVVETPGHTPGSICLLDRDNRVLFSGDTLSYGPVFLFGAHRDMGTYRQTLDTLGELGGFDTIYPCHNTCPISLSVIWGLKNAVDGAMNGTIPPSPWDMPVDEPDTPQIFAYGKCSILCNSPQGGNHK